MASPHLPADPPAREPGLRAWLGVFRYSGRALELVWTTRRSLTVALLVLTVVGGLVPAAIAWAGKSIVDGVVLAHATGSANAELSPRPGDESLTPSRALLEGPVRGGSNRGSARNA